MRLLEWRLAWREAALTWFAGIAFWAIIILLVIFATAEGGKSPITAFFAAFGAVGQVFFAFMVWKLSREQFHFSRHMTERQARIDAFALRKEVYLRWRALSTALYETAREDVFHSLLVMKNEIALLYPAQTVQSFGEMVDGYISILEIEEIIERSGPEIGVRIAAELRRPTTYTAFARLRRAADDSMTSSMKIDLEMPNPLGDAYSADR